MGVERSIRMRRIQEQTTANARSLRSDMTDVERMLWRALRGKQLEHSRFRRQHPIGPYIADFACLDKKLVIELDGGQHQDRIAYDARRTAFLQLQGWQVVRFWNNDVLNNLDGVLATVVDALNGIHPA
ncbi:endonuclease domain-containing protein [Undibacterium arcticum]|uniref:Endonuclease domain-containing protein n=1 Tax=Undibacterium arcticum TaxID=1762892 RepID=A0ABV7F0N3_9BURK